MPYEDERKNWLGQSKIAGDEDFVETLNQFNVGKQVDSLSLEDIEYQHNIGLQSENSVDTIYSIDGSRISVDIGGAAYGVIEVSVVKTDVATLVNEARNGLVNPAVVDSATESQHLRYPFPSSGVFMKDKGARDAWRELIKEWVYGADVFGNPLEHGYKRVLSEMKPESESFTEKDVCPVCRENCVTKVGEKVRIEQENTTICPNCSRTIYPTDRFGMTNRVANQTTNTEQLTQLMKGIEHLAVCALAIGEDSDTAIMKDGPLAYFGGGGWLARGMQSIFEDLREEDDLPLVVGIQKSGDFNIFADKVNRRIERERKEEDKAVGNVLVEMSAGFIQQNIKSEREVDGVYGEETYYGKNFIYLSNSGSVFSLQVPRRYDGDDLLYQLQEYPRLKKTLRAVEDMELDLYEDSLIPVHEAHNEATISESMGEKVLRRLGEDEIDQNELE